MNIYQTINAIMEEIEPISKSSINKQQGFKYRGVDAVMNALQPLFAKHKLFCLPEVIQSSREERTSKSGNNLIYSILRTKYTFYAEDGSSVCAIVEGEGMDSADKATNKALAIAFKYVCFQLFCIPTEDVMSDPDKDSPDLEPKNKIICSKCEKEIQGRSINGSFRTPEQIKESCKGMCVNCFKETKIVEEKIEEVEVK